MGLGEANRSATGWVHLCVDMQRMFAEDTPWHVPWVRNTAPAIEDVAERFARRTVFTRFIPPRHGEDMPGTWRDYYDKWWMMTQAHLPAEQLQLLPGLQRFVPPARIFDKSTYSPWGNGALHAVLSSEGVHTVVLTGGETDMCVLATALGAIDLGFHVILLKDAVCSGSDDTHDASLALLGRRFAVQVQVLETRAFVAGHDHALSLDR